MRLIALSIVFYSSFCFAQSLEQAISWNYGETRFKTAMNGERNKKRKDIRIHQSRANSLLHLAAWMNKDKQIDWLMESEDFQILYRYRNTQHETPIEAAVHYGATRAFKTLAAYLPHYFAADQTFRTDLENGWTLLHYAALFDRSPMINTLIEAGHAVNAGDYGSPIAWTALDVACWKDRKLAIKALIAKGAVTNDPAHAGCGSEY